MRKTGHLDVLCRTVGTLRLHNTEDIGTGHRIFAVHLVEVADTKQQDRIGVLRLDVEVLLHQWGFDYFRHNRFLRLFCLNKDNANFAGKP